MTQRELADRLEIDQKYVWALESGKNTIVLERIFANEMPSVKSQAILS